MIRLTIIDQDDKVLSLKDIPTAAELLALAEQARAMIRDCERLARQHEPKSRSARSGTAPYLS
jgi:hypothetical protein